MAEVSRKNSPSFWANSLASSVDTDLWSSRSLLLPISIMTRFLSAWLRSSSSHRGMWSKLCLLVIVRVWNSTPMVALESRLNSLRAKRARICDFPTAESPIRTTLKT
ncbi:unnamed protein product [Spirodela intermedia]|uniref:Uncharacterized protein n=1 Tax=Spirodela intermedia TaxID=51605 RepID=A0A7I8KT61_SPIIN|nr:unnamed protein product [Spirodela intermedia]